MSSILLRVLINLGIKYEFRSAKDTYKKGLLKDQIHTILKNSKKIGEKIIRTYWPRKIPTTFLPYFPVCTNCNRLYTAESFEYISDEKKGKISSVKMQQLGLKNDQWMWA